VVTAVFAIPSNQSIAAYTVTVTFTTTHGTNTYTLANGFNVTSSAVPSIQLSDAGTTIAYSTGSDSFGDAVVGSPVSKTFTVTNSGNASLTLSTPISVPSGFSVASSFAATTLAVGASTTFSVQMTAASAGSYSGNVSFANNTSQNPFTFAISGLVTSTPQPDISVSDGSTAIAYSTGSDSFGTTFTGAAISKTFTVKNIGTAALTLSTPISVPTGFTVTSSFGSTTLAAGASTTFTVQMTTTSGAYNGTVSFGDNVTGENPFTFTISGSVSSALLNSWFLAGQGEYAKVISGYNVAAGGSTTWPTNVPNGTTYNGGNSTPALGDVQEVSYSTNYAYVYSPDLASYTMGPWYLDSNHQTVFQNWPSNQNEIFKFALGTYPSSTHTNTALGAVGLAVNGVSIFNNQDGFSYNTTSAGDYSTNGSGTTGAGIWNRDAEYGESATFDEADGHQPPSGEYHYHVDPTALRSQLNDNITYVGTTNYFPYDPMSYLNHGQGSDGTYVESTTNLHHSPILGWTFDGHPIYGPYGYSDPTNANSTVVRMVSGYQLRNITTRTTLPGWAAQASFGANIAADGTYTLSSSQYGPNVSTTYPLGRYGEDYAYSSTTGTLDQYNGRWTVTPEFPNGVYAYFVTINANGTPAYPYLMGRQYYGTVNSGKVTTTTGDGNVTIAFNVATNTAPVVSGPMTASLTNGYSLAFIGGNLISMSDVDAAATESVTLGVNAGTIAVSLAGALASGCSFTAGSNGSAGFTLSGGVSQLNAALATLVYTAPATGTSATLTAQANDGSATNNLSLARTVTITLVNGNITGTSSADSVRIALDAADTSKADVYFGGSSTASYAVVLTTITQWSVSLGAGDDSLTIDFSNGNPLPVNGLTYDGGTHTSGDTLAIIGTSGADNVVLNTTQATLGNSAAMSFTNVEYFSFNLGAGQDSLVVQGGVPIITYNSTATTVSGGRTQINSASALPDGSAITIGSSSAFTPQAAIVASAPVAASPATSTPVQSSALPNVATHTSAGSPATAAHRNAALQASFLRRSAGELPWLFRASSQFNNSGNTQSVRAIDAILAGYGRQ
jgi:hypothetical protein